MLETIEFNKIEQNKLLTDGIKCYPFTFRIYSNIYPTRSNFQFVKNLLKILFLFSISCPITY